MRLCSQAILPGAPDARGVSSVLLCVEATQLEERLPSSSVPPFRLEQTEFKIAFLP